MLRVLIPYLAAASCFAINWEGTELDSLSAAPASVSKGEARQVKIRDLTEVVGEEKIKLHGFGVVSGLNGKGDSLPAAIKMLLNVAEKLGLQIAVTDLKAKNLAVVSISAEVDPNQKTFDCAVMSISDAKSLENGFLEGSTLSPVGSTEVLALASGPLALGARYFEGGAAGGSPGGGNTSITMGHPTMAHVMNGGQLIKAIPAKRLQDATLELSVKYPDNRTASNIADKVNEVLGRSGFMAEARNASTVAIAVPSDIVGNPGRLTNAIADIGELSCDVSTKAIITIDQGSGVIAMTEDVKMEPGSVAVAGLTVTVSTDITPVVRQGDFDGQTTIVSNPEIKISEDRANFIQLEAGTSLSEVTKAFNLLKLPPSSVISVLNAMHRAGMIHADIVVIPR